MGGKPQFNYRIAQDVFDKWLELVPRNSRASKAEEIVRNFNDSQTKLFRAVAPEPNLSSVPILENYRNHDFNRTLSRSEHVVLLTRELSYFLETHNHSNRMVNRFEDGKSTIIYVPKDPHSSGLTAVDSAYVNDLLVRFEPFISKHVAACTSEEKGFKTNFYIYSVSPPSTSFPDFALSDLTNLYVSFPRINTVSVNKRETRAFVLPSYTETLTSQLDLLHTEIDPDVNLVEEWINTHM